MFPFPSMTADTMSAYIEHAADRLLVSLGFEPMYHTSNPVSSSDIHRVRRLTSHQTKVPLRTNHSY